MAKTEMPNTSNIVVSRGTYRLSQAQNAPRKWSRDFWGLRQLLWIRFGGTNFTEDYTREEVCVSAPTRFGFLWLCGCSSISLYLCGCHEVFSPAITPAPRLFRHLYCVSRPYPHHLGLSHPPRLSRPSTTRSSRLLYCITTAGSSCIYFTVGSGAGAGSFISNFRATVSTEAQSH